MRLVVAIIFVVAACGGPTQSAAVATYLEFADHASDSAFELVPTLREFESYDISDADAIDASAQKLQHWADRETEWLDTHPPDPCYAATHLFWSRSVTHYGQAAKLYREAIAEHDPTKLEQGTAALTQGEADGAAVDGLKADQRPGMRHLDWLTGADDVRAGAGDEAVSGMTGA